MRRAFCGTVALSLSLGIVGQAKAESTVINIDVPGSFSTTANGINNSGQITGYYTSDVQLNQIHGFLYSGGSYTTLDVPGAVAFTEAWGVNDSGQIVGNYRDASGTGHGFLYSNGSYTTLDVPGSFSTGAFGINNSGQIVGGYNDASVREHGFLYSNGSYTTLDAPGAPVFGSIGAFGINNSGQIVGSYNANGTGNGFLYSNGSYTTLGVPGSIFTETLGINDSGLIVGNYEDPSGRREHGFLAPLGAIAVPEPTALALFGIGMLGVLSYAWCR
jgi:probable HAF family extracellular repeat protein